MELKLKKCLRCEMIQPIKNFAKNKKNYDGLHRSCRNCTKKTKFVECFVYIVINPAWPDYIKVGRSSQPWHRLDDYNVSAPFRDYEMYYHKLVNNILLIENYFKNNIESNGHEWFKIDKDEAIKIIKVLSKISVNKNKYY